ncbi:MAG TPA: S-layer homology domain-containing protein [Clostridiaceae bacterium]|nr:S-layer homology domain-containing protein [Clostridiaceae bacterium]
MIARAMDITHLKVELADGETDKLLGEFKDANAPAEYAKDSIAKCIKAGIILGKNGKLIAPKDNITRAESAAIVRRLLQLSDLI